MAAGSDSPESVWVDAQGRLHLVVRDLGGGVWCQAGVIAHSFARYGAHTFSVDTRLDTLDPGLVFGMFAYRNDRSEIDIEVTRAMMPPSQDPQIWNVVHGCLPEQNNPAPYTMSSALSTHRFEWLPTGPDCAGSLDFDSWQGHCADPPCEGVLSSWPYTDANVPCEEENLRPQLNLWLYDGAVPTGSDPLEVVISAYAGSQDQAGSPAVLTELATQDAMIRSGAFASSNYGGQVGGPAEQTLMGIGNNDDVFLSTGKIPSAASSPSRCLRCRNRWRSKVPCSSSTPRSSSAAIPIPRRSKSYP